MTECSEELWDCNGKECWSGHSIVGLWRSRGIDRGVIRWVENMDDQGCGVQIDISFGGVVCDGCGCARFVIARGYFVNSVNFYCFSWLINARK